MTTAAEVEKNETRPRKYYYHYDTETIGALIQSQIELTASALSRYQTLLKKLDTAFKLSDERLAQLQQDKTIIPIESTSPNAAYFELTSMTAQSNV